MCQGWNIEELGIDSTPFILSTEFNLMSAGRRCLHDGLDFVWLGSRDLPPYLIRQDGAAVVLGVENNIPYLACAGSRGIRPREARFKQARLPLPPPM